MNLKNIVFTVFLILLMGWSVWFFEFGLFISIIFCLVCFYLFWFFLGNKEIRSGFKLWEKTIVVFPKSDLNILPRCTLKDVGFINDKPIHKLVVLVRHDGVLVNLFLVEQSLSFYLIHWDSISRVTIDNLYINKGGERLYAEIHFSSPEMPKLRVPWCTDFESFIPKSVAVVKC